MRSEGGSVSRVDLFTQLWTLLCILFCFSGAVSAQDQAAQQTAPARQLAVVTVNANMRAQPSIRGAILSVVKAGTVVQRLSRSGSWDRVKTESGIFGWIHTSLLVRLQKPGIFQTAPFPAPASLPQQQPDEQQAAVSGTGQSTSHPTPVSEKPLIFPVPDPLLHTERPQRPPMPSAKRGTLLTPDSSTDTEPAPLSPARREILLAPDSSTDTAQPKESRIFPEANAPTAALEDLDTSASADEVDPDTDENADEDADEDDAGGLFGGSRLLILAALLVGGLGLLVFQIRRTRKSKQHIHVFEQNTRYSPLTWQPGEDLKPFIPHTQAEQAEQTDQEAQYQKFGDQEDPVFHEAEAALAGQDQDIQEVKGEESFIDLVFETAQEDSKEDSSIQPVEPLEPQSMRPEFQLFRPDNPGKHGEASPQQASSMLPPLPDLPVEFSPAERAVVETIFSHEEVPEQELKAMLDKRGFPGMLLKAVVGDIMRKTGSDGIPWIRVHYTQGVFSYQIQHLPKRSHGLATPSYLNGQEHSNT